MTVNPEVVKADVFGLNPGGVIAGVFGHNPGGVIAGVFGHNPGGVIAGVFEHIEHAALLPPRPVLRWPVLMTGMWLSRPTSFNDSLMYEVCEEVGGGGGRRPPPGEDEGLTGVATPGHGIPV